MKENKSKRLVVAVSAAEKSQLEQIALEADVSVASWVRQAIKSCIKEAMKNEAAEKNV